MKIKSRIIMFSLLFLGIYLQGALVGPVSASTVYVQNSTYYNNGTLSLSDQIQNILNNAASGDTIEFLGTAYENMKLVVTKKLNIVSHIETELSGNSSTSPVIMINGPNSAGTKISGFTITNASSGIVVNNTCNTSITNNSIRLMSESGVTVNNSKNTKIVRSRISNNTNGITVNKSVNTLVNDTNVTNTKNNGIQIYDSNTTVINNSRVNVTGTDMYENGWGQDGIGKISSQGPTKGINTGNNVYVQNSDKIKITNSKISEGYRGISTKGVSNLTITNSTISNCRWQGILLSGYGRDILIKNNTIQDNNDGIKLDCLSKSIVIRGNIITENYRKATGCGNGHGVTYGNNFQESSTNVLEHNIITDNTFPFDEPHIGTGSNFYGEGDYATYLRFVNQNGWTIGTTNMKIVIVRTGDNTYGVYFVDGNTGETATDFPSTTLIVTGPNGEQWAVQITEGGGTLTINNATGTISTSLYDTTVSTALQSTITTAPKKYIPKDTECDLNVDWSFDAESVPTPNNNPTNNNKDNPGTKNGTTVNIHTPGNGITAANFNLPAGISAAAAVAMDAVSSAGDAGSNGADTSNSKNAQELFIDNTTKNPQFWGILGIIVLLFIIFGVYYRNDLMNIVRRSK